MVIYIMSYTITLEVDVDTEALDEVTECDFHTVKGGKIQGEASADVKKVLEDSVNNIALAESNLPMPVALAISESIEI